MSKAPVVVLEGTWWSNHEVPLVLPYFHALSISHREIDLCHRTIRSVEDIAYYVARVSKNSGAMLYFACHGEELHLKPAGERDKINHEDLLGALGKAKEGAVSFIHFGCCEMIAPNARRETHQKILDVSGAKWSSGYTKAVDWLQSMFLDLALVTEVFVPQCASTDGRVTQLKRRATDFVASYEQLARELGFSALSKVTGGPALFPERLR
ncbi:hypothetical protein [Frigoriglobus tundricola]|nr:hypothetical protein [Frigoriglobus tundricola]